MKASEKRNLARLPEYWCSFAAIAAITKPRKVEIQTTVIMIRNVFIYGPLTFEIGNIQGLSR